jgi:hypothetical protein
MKDCLGLLRSRRRLVAGLGGCAAACMVLVSTGAITSAQERDDSQWERTFSEPASDFSSTGRSPYFILEPGYVLTFAGAEDGQKMDLTITVLDETLTVDGVETRVVEERELLDGKLVEISRNFFAISTRTGNVYYFGEDSDTYKDGKVINRDGSWKSGVHGATYGLAIPAKARVGHRYYQEIAPKVAMDRAVIVSTTEAVTVPAGQFKDCVKAEETTPLEPGVKEYKVYAPGIGLIMDGPLKLVKYGALKK